MWRIPAIILVVCIFIYGGYWIVKHGSYWLWYEDMVEETIEERVKPECLR